MKAILLAAAALTIGSAAIAQDAAQTTPPDTTMQPTPDTTTTQTPPDATTTQTTPDTTAAPPSGQTVDDPAQATGPQGVTQQNTVPDGQAVPPPGTNQGVQGATDTGMPAQPTADQQAAFTPRAPAAEYPRCSRTVTDSCIQSYERGTRRARRR